MPLEIGFDGAKLVIHSESGMREERSVGEKELDFFSQWAGFYRLAMQRLDNSRTLLAIGREIYIWLDGDDGGMERLLESFDGPPGSGSLEWTQNRGRMTYDFSRSLES